MKYVVFAGSDVGLEVVRILSRASADVSCLVLDERDPFGINAEIANSLGGGAVLTSSQVETTDGINALRATQPDIGIAAWWPYLLPPEVYSIPRIACLNFHPSLLPTGRGKHPNFWAIADAAPFGVTIHHVAESFDTGDIAWQRRLDVTWTDTGESLHRRSKDALLELFIEHLDELSAGNVPRIPQGEGPRARRSTELHPASRIDLDRTYTGRELLNLIRARTYRPHPAAWFVDGDQKYEVRVEIQEAEDE